jgi:hypothetical protein
VIVLKRETDRLLIICMGMSRVTGTREIVQLMTADVRLAIMDAQIARVRLTPRNDSGLSGKYFVSHRQEESDWQYSDNGNQSRNNERHWGNIELNGAWRERPYTLMPL